MIQLGFSDQHLVVSKEIEKLIASYFDTALKEEFLDVQMQFPCAIPGHQLTDRSNGFYDFLCLQFFVFLSYNSFMVSLFAYSETSVEPLCFKRSRFFFSTSFSNASGSDFFAKSRFVLTSKSAIIIC